MQHRAKNSTHQKIGELDLFFANVLPSVQQYVNSTGTSIQSSFELAKEKADEAYENHGLLEKLKADLRRAEIDLVKALADKTRKEAKMLATMEAISSGKSRIVELEEILQDRKAKIDEFAALLQQESIALAKLEENNNQVIGRREEIQEVISWYNRVLGLRIEGGHGVRFIFTNINLKNPTAEYSFTVCFENDVYTLLDCMPRLENTMEMIHELNRTNSLFKFVRLMRAKFQEAARCELTSEAASVNQECSISLSAPVPSFTADSGSGSRPNHCLHEDQGTVADKQTNKGFVKESTSTSFSFVCCLHLSLNHAN